MIEPSSLLCHAQLSPALLVLWARELCREEDMLLWCCVVLCCALLCCAVKRCVALCRVCESVRAWCCVLWCCVVWCLLRQR